MVEIRYRTGSVLEPIGEGNKLIPHVCNDQGGWGSGLVVAISNKWRLPEADYREWFRRGDFHGNKFQLGNIDLVRVSKITEDTGKQLFIINMIAQHKTIPIEPTPIRYDALKKCLDKVAHYANGLKASVHLGRIGCGLAGGTWDKVEEIIKETLIEKGIEVTVYTLEGDISWKQNEIPKGKYSGKRSYEQAEWHPDDGDYIVK